MHNSSFVGENFGEDFRDELENNFNRNYYLADSSNNAVSISLINDLSSSPGSSPTSKIGNNFNKYSKFNNLDQADEDKNKLAD